MLVWSNTHKHLYDTCISICDLVSHARGNRNDPSQKKKLPKMVKFNDGRHKLVPKTNEK